jgi:chromosome segregation ATPase
MPANTHEDMHAEHGLWRGEIGLWNDEIAVWQEELNGALAELKRLEAVLREQQTNLEAHRQAVATHEQHLAAHERTLAAFERGGPAGNDLLTMAKGHGHEVPRHARRRNAHERLKRRHHALMAHWSPVLKALAEAM